MTRNMILCKNALRQFFPRKAFKSGSSSAASLAIAPALFIVTSKWTLADSGVQIASDESIVIISRQLLPSEKKNSALQNYRVALTRLIKNAKILIAIFLRSIFLIYSFTPAAIASPLLLIADNDVTTLWWGILRNCIRKSGPCCMKFSQWISTRPDLFPLFLCKNLEDLQSKPVKHIWIETERALMSAFGKDWRSSLHISKERTGDNKEKVFSPVVLGSGCVAQVLLAQLDGRPVAVKIIHPDDLFSVFAVDEGVKEAIEADVTILRYLSWLMETVPGMTNLALSECVEEFSSLMMLQLDMKIEADNLDKFRQNFRTRSSSITDSDSESSSYESMMRNFLPMSISEFILGPNNSFRRIAFPEPFRPFVSPDILVESYEAGDQISDILDKMENKKLRRDIATAGLDAILKMVFEDNFIHADLHPGNVLFREYAAADGASPTSSSSSSSSSSLLLSENSANNWELTFIDAGLVSTLDAVDRRNFIDLFSAVVVNDGKRVGELMVDRSRDGGAKCTDRDKFSTEIGELVTEVHASGLSLGRIGVGALLQRVLVLCYTYQVKLEPKFVSVMIAMGVVEGLGKRLDPDVDVLSRAAPYVMKAALFSK